MKIRQGLSSLFFAGALFVATLFAASAAYAACSDPVGTEGAIVYNSTYKVAQFCNGTNWISMADSGISDDTLAGLSCASGQVAAWNGSAWACSASAGGSDNLGDHTATQDLDISGNDIVNVALMELDSVAGGAAPTYMPGVGVDSDTLAGLSCTSGQVAAWNGSAWACAAQSGGADDLGDHTATQNIVLGSHYLSGDGGNEGLTVDADGNVGVGVADASYNLEIVGTLKYKNSAANNTDFLIEDGSSTNTWAIYAATTGMFGVWDATNSKDPFRIEAGAPDDSLRIDADGNVGIGVTEPEVDLHVGGQNNSWQAYFGSTGQRAGVWSGDSGGIARAIFGTPDAGSQVRFNIGGGDLVTLLPNGNVGIGVTDPAVTLTVVEVADIDAADSGNDGAILIRTGSDVHHLRIDANELQASNSGAASPFGINPFGGDVYVGSSSYGANLQVRGTATTCTIGNGTGNTSCSSDIRLKKNVVPLEGALDKVTALQGVSFDWKKSGEHAIGVIAQDVEKVFPEVVTTDEETGMKAVSYPSLVAPLIESVKELKAENDGLKAELAEIKVMLEELKK